MQLKTKRIKILESKILNMSFQDLLDNKDVLHEVGNLLGLDQQTSLSQTGSSMSID